MRHMFVVASIVGLLALVPAARPTRLSAANGQQSSLSATQHEHGQAAKPDAQEMMKMHRQMMDEMKAADAKLDQLVQQMNAASGEAKVTATAAVVTELVRQQKSMHEHMGRMHEQMMSGRGMMKH
jgi:predicted metalloendopeptidase